GHWDGGKRRRVRRSLAILIGLTGLAACSAARDPLADLATGEHGRVVRVLDGDALVLDTGQSVRLVGIEAPAAPYRDREGDAGYEEAKRLLDDMALGREVELRYGGLTRDRYDRALAHVVTTDALGPRLWLNAEMIRKGGARVRVYPDTATANEPLLALESAARAGGRGLWGKGVWPIHNAASLPGDAGRFLLVEGVSGDMQSSDERFAVCDVSMQGSALVLEVQKAAAELCQLPEGARARARGFLRDGRLEISHPLNLEKLEN
ncbi:MAG: thermonuclease family protein, partial [Alphaproteobacteria bacterium]|nr:thermonuclease family protein [Alphaproteobacteria bacterium]